MGVDGLNKYLQKNYPNVYTTKHISEFSFKRVSFDISSYIYRYISAYGKEKDKWLIGILNLIYLFKKYAVHIIPIFDGKAPLEKQEEQTDRRDQRDKADINILELKLSLGRYKKTGISDETLQKIMIQLLAKQRNKEPKKLLKKLKQKDENKELDKDIKDNTKLDISKVVINVDMIEEYIEKREKNIFDITKDDIFKLKGLLNIFKIPYIEAPDEAEALGCYLVNNNQADAILSLDSDCMAYKTSIIINELDVASAECRVIYFQELMEELDFKEAQQVTDLCIICGNDYNRHTKNIDRVGPAKAHALLKQYGSYNEIKKHDKKFKNLDDGLIYDTCIKLFNLKYPDIKPNLYWDINIDIEKIIEYLEKHNLPADREKITRLWKPYQIKFVDE